jgi:hypothetical protein
VADFNVRSDSVNVEQIMEQIRARIREKRGVDYTEAQIRELATVKLQKFLDPRGVRSDLLDQFRRAQPLHQPAVPNYAFEDSTLFDSHRGALRFVRRLLKPILKLFFNPNPLIQALHIQSRVNSMINEREARLEATESLYYELIHNLVVETTRLGIEVKNLTMRVESISSRLEFSERRARALESAVGDVIYQPAPGDTVVTPRPAGGAPPTAAARDARGPAPQPQRTEQPQVGQPAQGQSREGATGEGPGQRSRRRRRRRGRRGATPAAVIMREGPQPPAAVSARPPAPSEPEAPGELSTRAESATIAEPAFPAGPPPVQPASPPAGAAPPEGHEASPASMPAAPPSESEPQ